MEARCYANDLPDYNPDETTLSEEAPPQRSMVSTSKLLSPPAALSEALKSSALSIKNTVIFQTWESTRSVHDYTVYTGAMGTAYLLFKCYQVTNNKHDLQLCNDIIAACDSASRTSKHVTFLCGRAGVYALGAVAAKHSADQTLLRSYLKQLQEIKFPIDSPHELLYGGAGYLWACSFVNRHIGKETISASYTRPIVEKMIQAGRRRSRKHSLLMYEWHGKKYWGAAHGLAGILHVLMDSELTPDEMEDVKGTLRHMIRNRFTGGNYPSSEGSKEDRLVHWCHGAPGVALTLAKAATVFGDDEFVEAAVEAGEVVWRRGLLKRVGLCHGISGNAYVFLSLFRLTNDDKYLHRAKAFACFLHDRAPRLISEGSMHSGDRPYSLFEGIAGMAYLFFDMGEPFLARFPAYEL